MNFENQDFRSFVLDSSASSAEDIFLLALYYLHKKRQLDSVPEPAWVDILNSSFDFAILSLHRPFSQINHTSYVDLGSGLTYIITDSGENYCRTLKKGRGAETTIDRLETYPIRKKKEELQEKKERLIQHIKEREIESVIEKYNPAFPIPKSISNKKKEDARDEIDSLTFDINDEEYEEVFNTIERNIDYRTVEYKFSIVKIDLKSLGALVVILPIVLTLLSFFSSFTLSNILSSLLVSIIAAVLVGLFTYETQGI